MARALKAKKLAHIEVTREGSIYRLQVEDEAGKKGLFEVTSDQALRLAYILDNLLADEEEEQHPKRPPPDRSPSDREGLGTIKWYNVSKGFGFVMPDGGGDELFLHRSALEQAGMKALAEGTRVRFLPLVARPRCCESLVQSGAAAANWGSRSPGARPTTRLRASAQPTTTRFSPSMRSGR